MPKERTTNPKVTGVQTENTSDDKDRVSIILMLVHFAFGIAAAVLIIQIFNLWLFYKPTREFVKHFTPTTEKRIITPVRGSILSHDGKLLAASVPVYQVYMDCTVRKNEFEIKGEKGEGEEASWREKARALSAGLAEIYGDRTADEYFNLIMENRTNDQKSGRKHVKIGGKIDYETMLKVKSLPLFNEGQNRGGYILEQNDSRKYPYDNLARRVIGKYEPNNENNSLIGIEGKYNYILSGKPGIEWKTRSDNKQMIRTFDSTAVEVQNGKDIRTTLNIEFQDIVDRTLRQKINENDHIEGGCAIIMEVQTGAIKAMVNLKRNDDGTPGEIYNYAIGRKGDPGSVFKLATLMTLLEDGKIKSLNEEVPTSLSHWEYGGKTFSDHYLVNKGASISIRDAFKISSNNVFRYLACKYYEDDPKRFINKLYEYKLMEKFDFDIDGLATPEVLIPGTASWSQTALPSVAIGYSVLITPLHILTFYNAVANKGKMMKPYLVEALEENGHVTEKFEPSILNGSICSQATVDTLMRALTAVTSIKGGTAYALHDAKCTVAGKTGTARIPYDEVVNGKRKSVYDDGRGNRQHQATFVGFFPAENPKYSAIVVMYSKKGLRDLYGSAGVPVFKEIVNEIFVLSEDWEEPLVCKKKK